MILSTSQTPHHLCRQSEKPWSRSSHDNILHTLPSSSSSSNTHTLLSLPHIVIHYYQQSVQHFESILPLWTDLYYVQLVLVTSLEISVNHSESFHFDLFVENLVRSLNSGGRDLLEENVSFFSSLFDSINVQLCFVWLITNKKKIGTKIIYI